MLTHSPKHSTGSPLGEKAPRQHPAPYRSPRPSHSLRRARKDEPAAGPKGGPPQGGARRRVPRRSHRLLPPGRCRHPSGQHPPRRAGSGSVGRDGAVRGPVTHRVRPAGGGGEPRAGRGAPQRPAAGRRGSGKAAPPTHASNLLFIVARRRHLGPPQRLPLRRVRSPKPSAALPAARQEPPRASHSRRTERREAESERSRFPFETGLCQSAPPNVSGGSRHVERGGRAEAPCWERREAGQRRKGRAVTPHPRHLTPGAHCRW